MQIPTHTHTHKQTEKQSTSIARIANRAIRIGQRKHAQLSIILLSPGIRPFLFHINIYISIHAAYATRNMLQNWIMFDDKYKNETGYVFVTIIRQTCSLVWISKTTASRFVFVCVYFQNSVYLFAN